MQKNERRRSPRKPRAKREPADGGGVSGADGPEAELATDTPTAEWPPRFTLDQEQVLNLFIGEGFYTSADASLREAILNALDACGRREADDAAHTRHIAVLFDRASRTFSVEDNGDGMGRGELAGLFAKVGASASRLAAREASDRYRAVGTFGIGVISYFLVCDEFEVQTMRSSGDSHGLVFSRQMLDGVTASQELQPERLEIGTTVRLRVKEDRLFDLLVERFPFWIRDVPGLTARVLPEGDEVQQGGLSRAVRVVETELPEWAEAAHIGPPTDFSVWDSFDGRAKVDILYRGVHVDRLEIPGLWGIEGAIHVDPEQFRPRLNREGFVGQELVAEVDAFLRKAHPTALIAALATLREDLGSTETSAWSISRWAAIWLAVPRGGEYEATAMAWDEEFRTRPTLRLLGPQDSDETEVSIADLNALGASTIFIAPSNLARASVVVRQAVRALRARGNAVIQGIERDPGFLSNASWVAQTTGDLLLSYFRDELPELRAVEPVAEELVRQDSIADLFAAEPRVRLVHLGADAVPLVAIRDEIWINVDVEAGKRVTREVCDRNDGSLGLWIACLLHCPEQTGEVSRVVRAPTSGPRLGPVMRQFVRSLIS